jgi:hypothetical protein
MRPPIFRSCALLLLSAACKDGTAPAASHPVSVSFTTTAAAGAASASLSAVPQPATASTAQAATADVLLITSAQLVIARVELVRAGAVCTSDQVAGDDDATNETDCAELELGPTLVDLPVNGTTVNALNVTVPEGSYSSVEAKLRPVRSEHDHGRGSAAFLTAHPDLNGVSIRVGGKFNGVDFTYTSAVSTGIERAFSPPLTVGSTGLNVTINADLASWFKTSSNTLIDPATANANGPNAQLVADNIKRSFRAFRDDDHDGHDDDR